MGKQSAIGVIGAGTWGMALARMLTLAGNYVQVWSALPDEIEEYSTTRRHRNLPNMVIPEEMDFTLDLEEVCTDKDILLFAVPSVFVRKTARCAAPYIKKGQIIVDVAKGIEPVSFKTMSEVIRDEMIKDVKIVALSGPTHAEEVARFEQEFTSYDFLIYTCVTINLNLVNGSQGDNSSSFSISCIIQRVKSILCRHDARELPRVDDASRSYSNTLRT